MKTKFIHTHVSVDCIILGFGPGDLNILLVKKDASVNEAHSLKLPGSLIYDGEDVDDAAARVLYELTGIKKMPLRQFRCFASPDRANKPEDMEWLDQTYQPNISRLITVAYIALCKIGRRLKNVSKYKETQWVSVNEIPLLPFDHNRIVRESLVEIRRWIEVDSSLLFELLPIRFTISQLHQLCEAMYGKRIDLRNFHKKVASMSYVTPLEEKQQGVAHRAARYYRFDKKIYNKLKANI